MLYQTHFVFEEPCCDRMVVGFTTTCAISAYHYECREFASRLWRGVLDTTLCDKVCRWLATGRSLGTLVSSTNKADRHDINEILLKVALNTITLTLFFLQQINKLLERQFQTLNFPWRGHTVRPLYSKCTLSIDLWFNFAQLVTTKVTSLEPYWWSPEQKWISNSIWICLQEENTYTMVIYS
jgi:hypothetical protein